MPVSGAPRRATSCRAPFLLLTRSCAMTPRGTSRSAMSINPAPPRQRYSSALASHGVGPRAAAAHLERRIDPSDIAVAATVDEVELAVRAVAEQQHRRIGQVHPHHRFAD